MSGDTNPLRVGGNSVGNMLTPLEAAIRSWSMRPERPVLIRVFGRDGREHDIELARNRGVTWAEAAKTMASLDPERLEAYDDSKPPKLLRAAAVADLVRADEKTATVQAATVSAVLAAATDPETQRFIVVAELLERMSRTCIEAIRETSGAAFTQMQEISSNLAQQAQASTSSANDLSVAIRNLLIQQAQQAVEAAAEQELTPMEQMAANFLSGQQMRQMQEQQQTNGAAQPQPNGKTKPNGKH